MQKFLKEVFTYFWIPLIITLVSYIFFQLHAILLGVTTLVALSAIYLAVQLYFLHKKWWFLVILVAVALGYVAFFLLKAPTITLSINGQEVKGTSVVLIEGSISVTPAPQSNGEYAKNTKVTLTAAPAPGYDWIAWQGTEDDTSSTTTVTMSRDKQITAVFQQRFTIVINNQAVIGSLVSFNEGSVLINPPPEGDGRYTRGTKVILTARPNSGYDWKGWLGTGNDASNPASITVNNDSHIAVIFEQRFSLTIGNQLVIGSAVSFSEGSVSVSPAPGADGKYSSGASVTLTANPNAGYEWKSWLSTGNDTSNPTLVTISSDKHVAVTFDLRFSLTVNSNPASGASANVIGGSVSIRPATGKDGLFSRDTGVVLTATPASGYRFDRWSGDASGSAPTINLTMNANKSITAVFIKTYTLTTTVDPAIGGTVSPGGGTYDEGVSVSLTATPASGYRFDRWSGDASGSAPTINLTMNANKSITAVFIKTYTLTTTVDPAIGGTVSPGGGTYDEGVSVSLTATPASGYRFDRWSGDASGSAPTINLTMNANKSITAVFIKTYTLTTTVDPAIGGTVSPGGGTYDEGVSVSLTATPASGYRFDRWSGDASGSAPTINLTMNANKSITAVFIKTYTLTTTVDPAIGGTVSPGGGTYDEGVSVSLTATPASGYRFDRWSGDASGSAPTINLTMNANKSITAVFIKTYTLTTTVDPAIGGTVSPGGGTYDEGVSVSLTATPASGYRFDRWSGDASGSAPTINLTMNANKSITAVFIKTYTLTTTVDPAIGGTVSPGGGTYDEGVSVSLTATPASGYRFDRWSGDASGSAPTINLTMNANKSITATFVRIATTTPTSQTVNNTVALNCSSSVGGNLIKYPIWYETPSSFHDKKVLTHVVEFVVENAYKYL